MQVILENGINFREGAIEFKQALESKNNDLVFKGVEKINTYCESEDLVKKYQSYFEIYHKSNTHLPIGNIGQNGDGIYWVNYLTLDNGRYNYECNMYVRSSKYLKSALSIAIKELRIPTFDWIISEHLHRFTSKINSFSHNVKWDFERKTGVMPVYMIEELYSLHNQGYQFSNSKAQDAVKYIVDNKEKMDKYFDYKPDYVGVWIQPNSVIYRYRSSEDDILVNTIDDLPPNIRGNMAVLDIVDKQEFVENVGYKENDHIYWVFI